MAPYIYKPTTQGGTDRRRATARNMSDSDRTYSTSQKRQTRKGYGAVPRARGAAVTGEMKYYDADASSINIVALTTTWPAGSMIDPLTSINLGSAAVANPLCLCVPTVGAALNQRIGRQIKIMKIKVRGSVFCPPQDGQSATDATNKVRLLLVQDTQTNASQMTGAQLFQDATASTTTINSFQNPNNFGRFRVLKDKVFTFSNVNMTGTGAGNILQSGLRQSFKFNINFKEPITVHFNATNGGTVADIIDNSFHMVAGTDNTSFVPLIAYYARTAYKE